MAFDLPPKLWLPQKPAIIRAASLDDVQRAMPLMGTFAAASARGLKAQAAAGVGNDSFTKLLLHCDGADASTTFADVSVGGAHGNATVTGNAQVDTAQSKFGGASLLLDNTGDYLSYATNADWNFGGAGAGDFTIDCWIRFNTVAAADALMSATNGSTGWEIYFGATTLNIWHGAGTEQTLAWTRSTATWYHVAVVRSGSTNTAYVNGTSLGNFASDRDWNNDGNTLYIGGRSAFGGGDTDGWMDEIRISKGIARWTSSFTPPTAAYS